MFELTRRTVSYKDKETGQTVTESYNPKKLSLEGYMKAFQHLRTPFELNSHVLKRPDTDTGIFNMQDLHFGIDDRQLQAYRSYLTKLNRRLPHMETAVVIIGGDTFHSNTATGSTVKGTQVELGESLIDTFASALTFHLELLKMLHSKSNQVIVLCVHGNHSRDQEIAMFAALMLQLQADMVFVYDATQMTWLLEEVNGLNIVAVHDAKDIKEPQALLDNNLTNIMVSGHYHTTKFEFSKGWYNLRTPTPNPFYDSWSRGKYVSSESMMSYLLCSGSDLSLHSITHYMDEDNSVALNYDSLTTLQKMKEGKTLSKALRSTKTYKEQGYEAAKEFVINNLVEYANCLGIKLPNKPHDLALAILGE